MRKPLMMLLTASLVILATAALVVGVGLWIDAQRCENRWEKFREWKWSSLTGCMVGVQGLETPAGPVWPSS